LAIGGGHAISFRDGLGATARPGRSGVTGVPARGCFTAGAVWAASGSHLGLVWKSMGRMPTPSAVRLAAALIVKRAPPGPGNVRGLQKTVVRRRHFKPDPGRHDVRSPPAR